MFELNVETSVNYRITVFQNSKRLVYSRRWKKRLPG